MKNIVQTGLERFLADPPPWMKNARLGLLCNPASVDSRLRHARQCISNTFPGRLAALFSPQHGFFAEKQDNMIESGDMTDPLLALPVFSLYGDTRIPTREMFDAIDVLAIDLQDVGTRVYTFVYTVSYCMEIAAKTGKKIVILDRPNPIGGIRTEGNCLKNEFASFVGRYPIPMRHGLTMGEIARLFNDHFGIGCDLSVIPMRGWQRGMYYPETGLPWVAPSPNMPTPQSAMVYPGQVIWEGTNISEGRGTTQPFELFGAPFFDTDKLLKTLGGPAQAGAFLRPCRFEPTANKWAGIPCNGFQIHVTDPILFQPYATSLKLLSAVIFHHPEQFQWKEPPYEYEYDRLPMDLIIGDRRLRECIEKGSDIDVLEGEWRKETDRFSAVSEAFFLYR
jgi:uncharacterized protein YbbC (DUF1343 family)